MSQKFKTNISVDGTVTATSFIGAGGTITGNLDVDGIIDNTRNNTNAAPPSISDHTAGTRIKLWDSSDIFFYALGIENGHLWSNADTGFKWYQRAVEKMSLSNGNLTVTGTLSASGYNKSNWDTAYSWGDHDGLYLPIAGKAADSNLFDGLDSSLFIYGNNSSGTNENNVNDWNAPTKTGFYSSANAANRWAGTSDWSSILHFKLYDDNNNYASQLGFNTYNNKVFARTNSGGTWTAWDEFITSANIGSQSVSYATSAGTASNADYASNSNLLDSLDSSQFLRSDEQDVMTGDGAANTYRGVLRINNTGTYKWGGIAFPDDVNAADSAKNNYYFIGRGDLISDRVMSFHIPTGGNYESGIQPKFVFASTGADQLMTIQATTGNVFVKGDLGVGTSTPSTYMSGTKGISIVNATNAALGLSNGTNNWLNYLSGDTYRIWNNTKDEVVTIALNGNIGIGTNSPIDGGSAARWVTLNGTSYSGGIAYAVSGNGIAYHYAENNFLISQGTAGVGHKWFANSALKMTMLSSGDLGIGTDSPTNKLTVNQGGGVRVIGISSGSYIEMSGDLPGYADNTYPVIKSGGTIHFANNGKYSAYLDGNNTSFGLLDFGATERVFLNTSGNSYLTGGNVGIGTTSPGQKLHVDGNVLFNGGTSGNTAFNDVNIGGISGWSTNEAHRINFVYGSASSPNIFQTIESHFDGNTSRLRFRNLFNANNPSTDISMTILGNGNVGIGVDTPIYKHQIQGSGDVLSTIKTTTNTGSAAFYSFNDTNNTTELGIWSSARSTFGVIDPNNGYLYASAGLAIGSTAIKFGTGASLVEAMRIDSSQRVGIGTSFPSNKLTVKAADLTSVPTLGVNQGHFGIFNGSPSYGLISGVLSSGNAYQQVQRIDGIATAYDLLLQPSGGNVGIGNTDPARKLTIEGNSSLWDTAPQVAFYDSVVTTNARNWTIGAVSTNYGDFNIASSTAQGGAPSTPRLTINKDGIVGIGTDTPASYMSGTKGLSILDASYAALGLSNGTNNWLNYLSGSTYRIWNNSVNEVVTILLNGNVGIAKTNPDYKLDVAAGTIKATNDILIGEAAYSISSDYVGMKTTFQSGSQDYMILSGKSDGNTYVSAIDGGTVFIRGGGNSSTNQIQVFDDTYILATTSAFRVTGDVIAYYSSDKQLKDNITPIPNALDKVKAIGGYEFDWNDKQDRYEGHDIGVIAQEVEAVLPELVATREDGYKAVKYEKLVAVLIEAIKDQQKQIEELKAIVNGITK